MTTLGAAMQALRATGGDLVFERGRLRLRTPRGAKFSPDALEALRTHKAVLTEALSVLARFPGAILLNAGKTPPEAEDTPDAVPSYWAEFEYQGERRRREWFTAGGTP